MVANTEARPTIVLADESRVVCRLMVRWFEAAGFTIAGLAHDGPSAIEQVALQRPTVATIAIKLPKRNGLEVISEVMRHTPTPMVVVSGITREAASLTLKAIELGPSILPLSSRPMIGAIRPCSVGRLSRKYE